MSAFSAAASDEDGDIISALREKLGRAHALCRIRLDRIRELEAMLAAAPQPPVAEKEPVAWMCTETRVLYDTDTRQVDKHHGFKPTVPLYAHPQQPRQPLTDDVIADLMMRTWGCASIAPRHAPTFARAIERAHGIGGEA